MVRQIREMGSYTKEERSRYCPFDSCKDDCSFKGASCAIETMLKREHKTFEKKYDSTFITGK